MVRPPMAGKGPPAVLRTVTSHLSLDVRTPLEILLSVAVADGAYDRSEILSVRHEDGPLDVAEIKMAHGGRMHRVLAPAGRLVVDYQATVTGQADLPRRRGRRPRRVPPAQPLRRLGPPAGVRPRPVPRASRAPSCSTPSSPGSPAT